MLQKVFSVKENNHNIDKLTFKTHEDITLTKSKWEVNFDF